MTKDLAEIITELSSSRKTGILSIGVKDDKSLFKIFFRDGLIYHITHGTCKDLECLAKLPSLEFDACMFMPGARVDASELAMPGVREIIERLKGLGKKVRWEEDTQRQAAEKIEVKKPPTKAQRPDAPVESGVIALMEEVLLNAVGPVSNMVVDEAYTACGLKKGSQLNYGQFARLVDTIAGRLPEDIRNEFVEKFRQ